jgi:hypothetical protein
MRFTFAIPLMLACVFALTSQQTAFASTITPQPVYKYWLIFPKGNTLNCTGVQCNYACKRPANATGVWCPIGFPWDIKVREWSDDPSFQHGYKTAVMDYTNFFSPDNDGDYDYPTNHIADDACNNDSSQLWQHVSSHHVANMTTCLYGYVQGFRHWCITDTQHCAAATTYGAIPRQILHVFDHTPPSPLNIGVHISRVTNC